MFNYENQPFIFKNTLNEEVLLYCCADNKQTLYFNGPYSIIPWNIKIKTGTSIYRPNLPNSHHELGEIVIECNPHITLVDSILTLIYVAGFCTGKDKPIIYHLCSMEVDETLTNFSNFKIIQKCFSGTYVNNVLFYTKKTISGDLLIKENDISIPVPNFTNIYRLAPIYNEPHKMIITGSIANQDMSYIMDVSNNTFKVIKNSQNEDIYKCTILDNKLIYVKRIANSEARQLIEDTPVFVEI